MADPEFFERLPLPRSLTRQSFDDMVALYPTIAEELVLPE